MVYKHYSRLEDGKKQHIPKCNCVVVQATLHAAMEEDDVREMYFWLERLAKNPYADDEVKPAVPGKHLFHLSNVGMIHRSSLDRCFWHIMSSSLRHNVNHFWIGLSVLSPGHSKTLFFVCCCLLLVASACIAARRLYVLHVLGLLT